MGGGSNSNLGVQILNSKIMVYTYDMQKTGFAIAPCKPASTAPDLKINNLCAKSCLISQSCAIFYTYSWDTGESFSEALLTSINPQYDKRLFIESPVQYMKIPS